MISCRATAGLLVAIAAFTLLPPAAAQDYQRETDRLAEEIAASVTKSQLRNVAVMDFTDLQGNVQEIGRFIAEELTTSLVLQSRSFKTIDRANLRNILAEQKLTMTGLINPENARKLKISGVDGLIRGTLTPFGDGIRITIQIIAVETAEIVGAARGVVPKTSAMDNLGGVIEDSAGSAGATTSTSSQSVGQVKKNKYVFQDGTLRVTLRYFRKDTDNKIKAVFLIENLKTSALDITWFGPEFVDDQAARWRLVEESGVECNGGRTTLTPSGSITGRLVFKLQDEPNAGTKFSMTGRIQVSDGSRTWISNPVFQDLPLGL